MHSARSALDRASASIAVPGLSATPAVAPASRMSVHRVVDVRRGLDVERHVVGAGLDEVGDVALGPLDHEVHVEERLGGQRLAQRADDDRPER